ncbi:DegT/DnrJ/EryC1/StrS family aminotransferase [Vacuolonema iberomarrocanum]|uniref:DegT/DnrJ/EryC1/StrS family aminotransferase n=1 Tax=Vacuolonema iberomarrocanum TaxID=3454632 RepID=UPI0019E1F6CE|nr:DegT/DnrJ/EryC1/StrS family aminotransferase [filamentous cyanobacterium LEGE 07170]
MSLIPPFDLTRQYAQIGDAIDAAVLDVLASGKYINGPIVQAFEAEFAQYIGSDHCLGCNSGTDALYLALRALEIGAGDEVITTPFSFFATAETISAVGATPVFVDIHADTFNLNVAQVEAAITPKTKAIMPVHLFGHPVEMTALMAIAQAHNLFVIEDCAQATGACWEGKKVGSIGHIGCFSFFPTKNLGACGDAGAVTTNDAAVAERIRILREHGSRTRYYHEAIGVNSRLDVLQAAVLRVKLQHLDWLNMQRRTVAQRYLDGLAPIPGIVLPHSAKGGMSVWNQFTIRVSGEPDGGERRDRLRQQLQEQGILSMIYYPVPLHQQSVYAGLGYGSNQLPVTEQVAQAVLSLPMFPELEAEQQQQIAYALKESLLD